MGTEVLEKSPTRFDEDFPCDFRACDSGAAWIGTPACRHSRLFCGSHMLLLSDPHIRAHCTVCDETAHSATIIWKEWRP